MTNLALIIDDEPDILELLNITLQRMSITTHSAKNLKAARQLLSTNDYHLCLVDMKLPDGNGVDFVHEVQQAFPKLPIAVITAHGSMDSAILALKYGAFDFLTKPVDLKLLRALIKNALNLPTNKVSFEQTLIGQSPAIKALNKTIDKLSRSQAPVYISGESGTGKELVARLIHELSARASQAFVPVNCGAISPELIESEFFGHEKGSFTGAIAHKKGLFQAAEGGTLFLDEIADLPQNMQVKLLRSIQEKRIRPVGKAHEVPVNVRILSATHKNLSTLVNNGSFREDLFYRINVIEVNVLPLRERREDIPLLVNHTLKRLSREHGGSAITIAADALERLVQYDFPGNIRELENILERAVVMCDGKVISDKDILLEESSIEKADEVSVSGDFKLDDYLADIEKKMITDALNKTKWNKTKAAKILGLSFRALRYKLKKLDL